MLPGSRWGTAASGMLALPAILWARKSIQQISRRKNRQVLFQTLSGIATAVSLVQSSDLEVQQRNLCLIVIFRAGLLDLCLRLI